MKTHTVITRLAPCRCHILALPAPEQILMPVGSIEPEQIRKLCNVERKREFTIKPTNGLCRVTEKKTWPYKGKWKTWSKIENIALITSFASISDGMLTWHHAIHGTRTLRAPAGMRWQADNLGAHLVRISDGMDYHPGLSDLLAPDFASRVRAAMAANWKARIAAKAETKRQAEDAKRTARLLASTCVTLQDSIRAGNCVQGSLEFAAKRLRMDREDIVRAPWMVSAPASRLLATGDQRAIRAAHMALARETMVAI